LTTTNKDFKVKNGIAVSGNGTFGGPVTVGVPTESSHAVTKGYLENLLDSYGVSVIDGGNYNGEVFMDGGDPYTTVWSKTLDAGSL
jgi:hypothetical protein